MSTVKNLNLEGGALPKPNVVKELGITLANDALFGLVMRNRELLTPLLRDILRMDDLEILDPIQTQSEQKVQSNLHVSVRYDIYCRSADKHFDVEVQTTSEQFILKRARLYSSMLDAMYQDTRKSSAIFPSTRYNLTDTYVIFMCSDHAFPGDKGRAWLQGETRYIDEFNNVIDHLHDGRHYIFINYDAPNLSDLRMDYLVTVANKMSTKCRDRFAYVPSDYTVLLDKAMYQQSFTNKEVNSMLSAEERRTFINEGRAEGIAEGRVEGRAEGRVEMAAIVADVIKYIKTGHSKDEIVASFGLSQEEYEGVIKIFKEIQY